MRDTIADSVRRVGPAGVVLRVAVVTLAALVIFALTFTLVRGAETVDRLRDQVDRQRDVIHTEREYSEYRDAQYEALYDWVREQGLEPFTDDPGEVEPPDRDDDEEGEGASSRSAQTGQPGPAGPMGPQGPPGEPGEPGETVTGPGRTGTTARASLARVDRPAKASLDRLELMARTVSVDHADLRASRANGAVKVSRANADRPAEMAPTPKYPDPEVRKGNPAPLAQTVRARPPGRCGPRPPTTRARRGVTP